MQALRPQRQVNDAVQHAPDHDLLTLAALDSFTRQHPASPRKTVQHYLVDQQQHAGRYDPAVEPVSSSPVRPTNNNNNKRRSGAGGRNDGTETALVMHQNEDLVTRGKGEGAATAEASSNKKRKTGASRVSALQPRTTATTAAAGTSSVEKSSKRKVLAPRAQKEEEEEVQATPAGSSPVLVARVDRTRTDDDLKSRRKPVASTSNIEDEDVAVASSRRRSSRKENNPSRASSPVKKHQRTTEMEPASNKKTSRKGKEKSEPKDDSTDGGDELAERLRARKERRRAKALIVKDRSQSAGATGAAAGAKLKASTSRRKKSKRDEAGSQGEQSEEVEEIERPKRKKGKASNVEINRVLQSVDKPKNVGGSRLTLKPSLKLGLFNKGAASIRTKPSKQLPDLAFSESKFLDGPRRSPSASSSTHSSASSPASHLVAPAQKTKPHKVVVTYGNKKFKKQRNATSKFFDPITLLPSSFSSISPPPPKTTKTRSRAAAAAPPSPRAPPPPKTRSKRRTEPTPPPSTSPANPSLSISSGHSAHSIKRHRSFSTSALPTPILNNKLRVDSNESQEPTFLSAPSEEGEEIVPSHTTAILDTSALWPSAFVPVPTRPSTTSAVLSLDEIGSGPDMAEVEVSRLRRERVEGVGRDQLSSLRSESSLERLLRVVDGDGGGGGGDEEEEGSDEVVEMDEDREWGAAGRVGEQWDAREGDQEMFGRGIVGREVGEEWQEPGEAQDDKDDFLEGDDGGEMVDDAEEEEEFEPEVQTYFGRSKLKQEVLGTLGGGVGKGGKEEYAAVMRRHWYRTTC